MHVVAGVAVCVVVCVVVRVVVVVCGVHLLWFCCVRCHWWCCVCRFCLFVLLVSSSPFCCFRLTLVVV